MTKNSCTEPCECPKCEYPNTRQPLQRWVICENCRQWFLIENKEPEHNEADPIIELESKTRRLEQLAYELEHMMDKEV